MNFDYMPLLHHPYGFHIMLAMQLGLAALLLWALRKRGWL